LDSTGTAGALGQCGINSMALPPVLFAGSPLVQSQVVDEVIQGRDLAERESGRIFLMFLMMVDSIHW
jgi:hypothetical protein